MSAFEWGKLGSCVKVHNDLKSTAENGLFYSRTMAPTTQPTEYIVKVNRRRPRPDGVILAPITIQPRADDEPPHTINVLNALRKAVKPPPL